MSRDFWRGKRVFLTGHTGFKGSWLAIWLHRLGAKVHGFALDPETNPNLFTNARVKDCLASDIRGDVRDIAALKQAMESADPDVVIHMAAQPLVRRSYHDPVGTYATNVMGTVHALEAARSCRHLRALLVVTSDKCYENRDIRRGYREDEPLGGFDPYSSSKACAELVAQAYRRSFFSGEEERAGVATARAGNVIGGGDWSKDRLIPDAIRAWLQDEPVRIRHPEAVRPWQHVLDALNGYLLLLKRLAESATEFSGAWNFGPEDRDARKVAWVVERFARVWGDGQWQAVAGENALHEASVLALDSTKARNKLNWKPALTMEEAIDWTVRWYRAFSEGADMANVTLEQVEAFEAKARVGHEA